MVKIIIGVKSYPFEKKIIQENHETISGSELNRALTELTDPFKNQNYINRDILPILITCIDLCSSKISKSLFNKNPIVIFYLFKALSHSKKKYKNALKWINTVICNKAIKKGWKYEEKNKKIYLIQNENSVIKKWTELQTENGFVWVNKRLLDTGSYLSFFNVYQKDINIICCNYFIY